MIWTTLSGSVTFDLPDDPTPEDVRRVLANPEILSVAMVGDDSISILMRDFTYTEFRRCDTEPTTA